MTVLYVAIGAIVGAILVWLVLRGRAAGRGSQEADQGFLLMQNQMNEMLRLLDQKFSVVDQKLTDSSKTMHDSVRNQFGESQRLIKEITQEITSVKEIGRQTQGFAEQLKSLQDVLKNPKQRGILGEYYLETLLKNVLPPGSYQMQYSFPDGTIVDAVVFVKDKIIPIDSKFSLENYNRIVETGDEAERKRLEKVFENDLKNRIVETSKYVQPDKKTLDFAFMFIPHEAIYYDLLIGRVGGSEDNLIQRAASKYKVIIVSPTSFLAYLQTVLHGLNRLEIEEKAKDIIKNVTELGNHMKKYEEHHNKLGQHLSTAVNKYIESGKEFKKIDKDITRISGATNAIEPLILDKPTLEE